jgi:hypothetical protein
MPLSFGDWTFKHQRCGFPYVLVRITIIMQVLDRIKLLDASSRCQLIRCKLIVMPIFPNPPPNERRK